jgi:hypothetical protein
VNGGYQTVFQVSYFSNGSLLESLAFLGAGIVALVVIVFAWKFGKINRPKLIVFSCVGMPFWFLVSGFWFYSNISTGKMWTAALANNQCEVVEGTVQVLHQQPWSGHDAGDHISIGGKDFTYSDYVESLGYHQTISHDGQLKNGAVARLHYIGDVILKVEIKQ